MKKRFLFIIAIGISFAPAVLASGVGPFSRSADADTAGASACSAGLHLKSVASESDAGSSEHSRKGAASAGDASGDH